MPIFMDRHDLPGATAGDLTEAHLQDLEIQARYGVKFMTYWFDHRRGTTFCLVDAPDKDAVQCVHRDSHGYVANEVVEVSLSAVEAFLGRIQDPEPPSGGSPVQMDSGHRAIMFTDIVGSTEMTTRLGDRLATELIRAHDSIVRRRLIQLDGREVKHTGDGIMASFTSTPKAVDCATAIQRDFESRNHGNSEPIHIRIGLDCGDPVADGNDLFGSSVQLAARLCAAASGDQILASENIRREHGSPGIFMQAKRRRLKGYSRAVPAFECAWADPGVN
jgi:class 3 adenylate cyclase